MERLVVNFTGGKARRATLHGRPHLVAPLALLMQGVLHGSQGALFYPYSEIAESTPAWNHMPIVVYHPRSDGVSISASDPDVLDSQGIGVVLQANTNGKLTAEGWFDIEDTRRVDSRVLDALERGEPMELSTGLYTENEPAPANSSYNGEFYQYIARNYKPDHLAILPDQVGACSLEDGCGMLVNGRYDLQLVNNSFKPDTKENNMDALNPEQRTELVDGLIANCECWEDDDREVLNGFSDEKLAKLTENLTRTHTNESKSSSTETLNLEDISGDDLKSEMKRREKMTGNDEEGDKTENEEKAPVTPEDWLEKAPVEIQNTFKYAHQIEQEQKTDIVTRLTANIEDTAERRIHADRLMKRPLEDLRDDLVLMPTVLANAGSADNKEDSDSSWLTAVASRLGRDFEDEPLMLPTINYDKDTDATKGAAVASSSDEDSEKWLRSAPAGVRSLLDNAMQIEQREREEIVSKLVGNIEDSNQRFRMRDRLEKKPLDELREMMTLMPKTAAAKPKANYVGSAAPAANQQMSDEDKEDILPLPTMDLKQA